MSSPNQAYFAALVCFAISGIMSMTFFRDDWGDRGTVMIGVMMFGAVAGLILFLNARKQARVGNLFQEITLETPHEELRPGDSVTFRLGLQPARDLRIEKLTFRLEEIESSHFEAEHMNAETAVVFEHEAKVEVGKDLVVGKEHAVEATLEVPAKAAATLDLQHHHIHCRLSVDIEGKDFRRVETVWDMEVAPRMAPGVDPISQAGGKFGTRVELEGLTLMLEDVSEPTIGDTIPGSLVLQAEEAIAHQGIEAALVWTAEGGSPETFEVDRVILADPGELASGDTKKRLGLEIPADAPPSYLGDLVTVRWAVHVDIAGVISGSEPAVLPIRVAPARGE